MPHASRPLLSIIIPTLNEADHLPGLLADLRKQEDVALEIIVGDGGSSDATGMVAEEYGALFICAPRGRGAQMNAAVRRASGDWYLFLHADSRIDSCGLLNNAVRTMMSEAGAERVAGHFSLRFIRRDGRNALAYRFVEEKSSLNRVNTTNGDQGLMLAKGFFDCLGGFDESLPFFEDQRIAEKIRVTGRWITLPGYIKTSARRFETEGFHRRYILMSMMMGLYSAGVEEFFVRAPGVYRVQQDTGRLLLTPFFCLIRRMMVHEWGVGGSLRIFNRLGRYIHQNSWQLFFFLDVWLHPLSGYSRSPLLRFFDRFVGPYTDLKIVHAGAGMICCIWYMGILAPFFRFAEHNSSARIDT